MKFSDRYKTELDNIKPDGYIKDKIRRKMAEENEKSAPKRSGRAVFGTAVAAVLCGAIIFSAGIVTGRKTVKVVATPNTEAMKTLASYDDIYDNIKRFKTSVWDKLNSYASGNMEIIEEAADDGETATGTNGSALKGDTAADSSSKEHSDTTVQVAGVDEADIVKTDGKYIYILSYAKNAGGRLVKIIDVTGEKPKQLASIKNIGIYASDMYLSGDRLIIIGNENHGDTYTTGDFISSSECFAAIYDISDPNNPKELIRLKQSGDYYDSRLIDGRLYVISNFFINGSAIKRSEEESFVPSVACKDYNGAVAAESVHFYNNCNSPQYTVICGYDIKDGALCGTQSVLGGSYTVYANTENIITCGYTDSDGFTQVARFTLDGGKIDLKATGQLKGTLLNQFSIDEYKGYFRFVLTDYNYNSKTEPEQTGDTVSSSSVWVSSTEVNSLVILDGELKETGKITDLAPGERVYSVRFMGDTAYFVTFRQVDPLFSADLSDPKSPKIIGSLKIPGFSNYLFPYGDKLLGIGQNADEQTGRTGLMKLSMFDISDPANVTESSKTDIPAYYSESLYNHKATLADYGKNIIGFPVYGDTGLEYFVYSYENGKFVQKLNAQLELKNENDCRGLYIGKVFYIAAAYELQYYDLENLKPLGTLELSD